MGGNLFVVQKVKLLAKKEVLNLFVLEKFLALPSRMFMLCNFLGFYFG